MTKLRRPPTDETPLPPAVPHHVADPTGSLSRISESELPTSEGAPTRPGWAPIIDPDDLEPMPPPPTGPIRRPHDPDAVPEPCGVDRGGDPGDDDDQTRPRDLPIGLHRRRPRLPLPAPPGDADARP